MRILWVFIIVIRVCVIFSQENLDNYIVQHYTTADGLASNHVYCGVEDDNGYIWLATDNGISRFDGKRFKTYDVKDGLKNQDIPSIYKFDNKIIVLSFNGVDVIEDGKVVSNKYPDIHVTRLNEYSYIGYIDSSFSIITADSIFVFNKETMGLLCKSSTSLLNKCISNLKITNNINSIYWNNKILQKSLAQLMNLKLYKGVEYSGMGMYNLNRLDTIMFSAKHGLFFFTIIKDNVRKHQIIGRLIPQKDKLFEIVNNTLIVYSFEFEKINQYNNYPIKLINEFRDISNSKCIISTKNGFYVLVPKRHFIQNTSVPSGNSILKIQDRIFVSKNDGMVLTYDRRTLKCIDSTSSHISDAKLVQYNETSYSTYSNNSLCEIKKQPFINIKSLYCYSRNKVIFGRADSIFLYDIVENKILQRFASGRAMEVYVSSRGVIYYGGYDGVHFIRDGKHYKLHFQKENNVRINSIREDKEGDLWISCAGFGVYRIDNKTYKVYKYSTSNGLISNSCSKIRVDEENRIWVLSNDGFQVIEKGKIIQTEYTASGLLSNQIQDIVVEYDTAYILSELGIDKYVLNGSHTDKAKIKLNLNELKVNGEHYESTKINLKPYQNNIEIDLSGIYLEDIDNLVYLFKLYNENKALDWETTNSNKLNFYALKPGKYTFEVYAKHKYNKSDSSDILRLEFEIQDYFYNEWWFWIFLVLTLTAIAGWIVYSRNKLKLEKLMSESELTKWKLQGLQHQMNPHFIFNSMNTIQNLMLEDNQEEALDFIADFSGLMRSMLQNSRNEKISLSEEIVFLKKYSDLEQIRYRNKFDINYYIQINEEDIDDIMIPTMMIQPLIENAIKHGVSNIISKRGNIDVYFSAIDEGKILQVIIEDNGDGVVDHNRKSHTSTAISVIQERLQIYTIDGAYGRYMIGRADDKTITTLTIPI